MAPITLINCQISIHRIGYANGDDLRRLQEYLAACGPSTFGEILGGMAIVNYAMLEHLAAARDMGLVELIEGKYQLAG